MNPPEPAEATAPLIRLRNAGIAASTGTVMCPDWSVAAGEAWLVAGGSSSGKTSLLRAVAGLADAAAGTIERFGRDWSGLSDFETLQQRRRIGIVLAREAGLFHRATVRENLMLPLWYHGEHGEQEIEERAAALLAALELEDDAHRTGLHLPPAVTRRALIARALALGPELLLVDEPVHGLDEWESRRLTELLRQLHRGHAVNGGRPLALVLTGRPPAGWRAFAGLRWAWLHAGGLQPVTDPAQLAAAAPELFQHPGPDDRPIT